MDRQVSVRLLSKQRGGKFSVSGWIALLLLALCVGEAAEIRHLFKHRVMTIRGMLPVTAIHGAASGAQGDDDYYVTHTFPEDREVCTLFNTICWIKI